MDLGLIVGIVFLIMLVASFAVLLLKKPGNNRRRDRTIEGE
jgi:hypothetical protein